MHKELIYRAKGHFTFNNSCFFVNMTTESLQIQKADQFRPSHIAIILKGEAQLPEDFKVLESL